jgi:hypothetical protein
VDPFSIGAGGPACLPKVYPGGNKTFRFAAVEPFYPGHHADPYGLPPADAMRDGVARGCGMQLL